MSQTGVSWQWFQDNGFDLQTPLLIFDDSFKIYGINYSLILKRAFFIINSLDDDIVSAFAEANLTFFGERSHFPVDFFKKINSLDKPVSIITANDSFSLVHLLNNTLQNIYITIKTPSIENFLMEPEDGEQAVEIIEKLKKSDALFFNTHGDILCTSLKYAILCAKDEKYTQERNNKLPACAISDQCFRKNRFKNKDSFRLIRFADLQAKVIFLNICAGFSLTSTKFDAYPNLLPLKAIENNTVVYISSYLIKYSTIEEMFLFWALLKKYRNFSLATFYFNKVSSSFLGEEKLIMMLGDGMINLESSDEINYYYDIIYSHKDEIIVRVTNIRTSSLFISLEINAHKLFTSCKLKDISAFIDKPNICSTGSWIDNIKINFIIQFHNGFPGTIHVHFSSKKILLRKIRIIEKKSNLINVYMSITIDQSFRNNLQLLSSEILGLFDLLKLTENQSDLNGTKYLYMHSITQKLNNKVSEFENVFLYSVIIRSLKSDTHLILDEANLLKQKNVSLTESNCYICGSNLYEMSYNYNAGPTISTTFIQSICPRCEIVSVRNSRTGILKIFSPAIIERDSQVNLRLEYQTGQKNKSTVKLGIALINGMVSIIENSLSFREKLIYNTTVKIPENVVPGLYYWRCILLYEGKVTISHKQVCICGDSYN